MDRKQLKAPDLVIAMDPGGTTGWSVFVKGELVACGYASIDKLVVGPLVWEPEKGGVLVIEYPLAYPGPKSEQDPNAILRTAWRAGELVNPYRRAGMVIEEVYPNGWKGTVSKAITYERVLDLLTDGEKKLLGQAKSAKSKSLDHNLIDAVGIGLWRVFRRINNQ